MIPIRGRTLVAIAALIVGMGPAAVNAQEKDRNRPTIQVAAGSHWKDGGDSQAISFGIPAGQYWNVLLSAERSHVPTKVMRFDNGMSVSRRGTVMFVGAEVRLSPRPSARFSPYAFAGLGRGTSRPNVNEFFPDRVTNKVALLFAGGGVRVPLTDHLSAFVDARVVFFVGIDSEELGGLVPIRGGLAWKF
jgi:hypothetical protein